MIRKLWNDEAGFIVSAELVLVATILVIAMVVGLVCIRNQVVQELIDVGQALGNISQTYGYTGIQTPAGHQWAYCSGASYKDMVDYCQDGNTYTQAAYGPAGGITFTGLSSSSAGNFDMTNVSLTGESTQ